MSDKKNKPKNKIIAMDDQETKPSLGSVDQMISLAIKEKVGVEQLEKLMELKHKYETREAQKQYHVNFCKMQSKIPSITKTKSVNNSSGQEVYRYAPLETIITQIKPYLEEYGFSYRWSEGLSEREGYKRIFCHIVGYGHQETSFVDIPIMGASKMTNQAQQTGSASTYGKRYSLIAVLGLMTDEDDDGQGIITGKEPQKTEPTPKKQPELIKDADPKLIKECEDLFDQMVEKHPDQVSDSMTTWISTIKLQSDESIQGVIKKMKTFGITT